MHAHPDAILITDRLQLRPAEPALAVPLAQFIQRNRTHFAPWEPPRSFDIESAEAWVPRLLDAVAARAAGQEVRWLLLPRADDAAPAPVIGRINFTSIARGPFQSCALGYQIDVAHEGRGLMREALSVAIAHLFGTLKLHRIEANYRPENVRSGALLARLGFVKTGLAPKYLFIDGDWRDHVQTQLINDAFDASVFGAAASAAG